MLKAYPRVWVDLTIGEVMSSLIGLFTPQSARANTLISSFENSFAKLIGTKEAVSFTNCRSGLFFILKALSFNEGDEVILPAFTFWIDVEMVVLAGLKPVFVDVEFKTMNIDPAQIKKAITPRTRAILLAHLNGLPVEMASMMEIAKQHGLRVIEDSARACAANCQGHRVGSFDIGAFSFGYGKSFYGFGGGMVTSDDQRFIANLRRLKKDFTQISIKQLIKAIGKGCLLKFLNTPELHWFTLFPCVKRYQLHGDKRFESWFKIIKPKLLQIPKEFTVNMYDLQVKACFRQLKTIDQTNKKRREYLRLLNDLLSDISRIKTPLDPKDRSNVNVHFAVWSEDKQHLQDFLMKNKIDAQDESAEDVTQMYRYSTFVDGSYPNAAKLHTKVVYIPTHPCLSKKDMLYISEKIHDFYAFFETEKA